VIDMISRSAPHVLFVISVLPCLFFFAEEPRAGAAERPLSALVRADVERQLPPTLALDRMQLPDALMIDARDARVVFRSTPHGGTMSVEVFAHQRDGKEQRGFVMLKLAEKKRTLVATRDLQDGEMITEGDLHLALGRVDPDRPPLDLDPSVLIGRRMRAHRSRHESLTASDVELPAVLARGSAIHVVARVGPIAVSTNGTLEHAARIGEETTARVQGNLRIVRGRLQDEGTLLVIDGGNP
jgi:flagella basal body P-ring formation protein FlgA